MITFGTTLALLLTTASAFAMRRTPPRTSVDDDRVLAECTASLAANVPRLTDEQTRGLLGSPGVAGLTLHRDFVREGAAVVTVTFTAHGRTARGVDFTIVGLSDEEATALAAIVRTDVEGQIRAKVYAGRSGDDDVRKKTVRNFVVTSGMRHMTTDREATQFFVTLTAVFAARLKHVEIRDRLGTPPLSNPGVQF